MSSSSTGRDEARIGDFVIENEIGKGAFAVVHKAHRHQTREPVAIKIVIRKKLTPKLLDNLEGEIAILKAIHHPNIVELKDCLKTERHIYLVMAFCASGDLSQYIKERFDIYQRAGMPEQSLTRTQEPKYPHPLDGGLNETIVRSILTQLAAALEFMRGRDIVHRDIKPQNLLLQPPDVAFLALGNPREIPQMKVADFGFARHLSVNTLAETLCGSPLYMAPEILRFEKYDAKADLWSVGAVLFEMTVGKPPFKAANHIELLKRIERGEDRIKFPDERSAGSLAREAARRQELGGRPLPPPHPVSEDVKTLIRQLLRQRPVSRMSFDDFFGSPVIRDFTAFIRPHAEAEAVERYQDLQNSERSVILPSSGFKDATLTTVEAPPQETSGSTSKAAAQTSRPQDAQQAKSGQGKQAESPKPTAREALELPKPAKPERTIPRAFAAKYVTGEPPSRQEEPEKRPIAAMARVPSSPGMPDKSLLTAERVEEQSSFGVNNSAASREGEDSFLGKEYVMIEKRNVEVNALADELAASPQNRMALASRRPSRLSRLGSGAVSNSPGASPPMGASAISSTKPIRIASNTETTTSAGAFALPPGARPSLVGRRTSMSSSGSPSIRQGGQVITAGDAATSTQSSRREATSSSQPKEEVSVLGQKFAGICLPGGGAGGPSSALAKAISMASLRLFGVSSGVSLRDAAALVRSRAQRRGFLRATDTYDEVEMSLLSTLEDLGQKAFVLSEFADSKLAHFFPDGPHQLSQDLDASTANTGISPGISPSKNSGSARRVGSISSSSSSALDPVAAESAAAEALMLYVRSLAFLQRAIGLTKKHIDSRSRPGAPAITSAELNEVVQWLRARFNEVYDKADFARSRCNELPESAQQVDKLIFDKAVDVARAAATDELENNRDGSSWDRSRCLLAYETASSMLSSLLDPGEEALSLSEGSILMIDKYVRSINKRLSRLQEQFASGAAASASGAAGSQAGVSAGGLDAAESRSRTDSPLSNPSPSATPVSVMDRA
ncbi:Serine/threonine-protein kinase ATG1 [Ustilago sp. UG-2017a]|nr:Serine/threonine-protein kinase ATG1 [Ustilago sp. UG-2017a]